MRGSDEDSTPLINDRQWGDVPGTSGVNNLDDSELEIPRDNKDSPPEKILNKVGLFILFISLFLHFRSRVPIFFVNENLSKYSIMNIYFSLKSEELT